MVLCEMLGLTGLGKAGNEGAEHAPSALERLVVFALQMFYLFYHYTALPTNNFLVNDYFLHLVTQLLPATSSFLLLY